MLEVGGRKVAERLMALDVAEGVADKCGHHFDLMVRWNRVHNLTRITTPEAAAISHYADCLRAIEQVQAEAAPAGPWTDIGSGAGFPGMLVAFCVEAPVHLVEPAKKRASFLTDVARRMGLNHVVVEAQRVQEMAPRSLILSRATLPWREASPAFAKLSPGGMLALMVSEEATAGEWEGIAVGWGADAPTCRTYTLPDGAVRSVLFARAPNS